MYSVFKFSEWKKSFCVQHKMILKENDLFFLCSLIDYIARKTKNYRSTVVNALGGVLYHEIALVEWLGLKSVWIYTWYCQGYRKRSEENEKNIQKFGT